MGALITTIAEIKTHIAVNLANNIESIRPYIEEAEIKYIKPILGSAFYEELLAEYESSGSGSGDPIESFEELLMKIQRPLVYFAYAMYAPTGNIQISDSGFHIATTETKKTAFQWQVTDAVDSWLELAHQGIDQLLEFLELNIEDYPSWKDSDGYTVFRETFITTAKEFSGFVNIHNSRRVFITLKSIMKKVEEFELMNVLGEDFYNELKADVLDESSGSGSGDGIESDNLVIFPWIKSAVAHLTVARAAVDNYIQLSADGVHMIATSGVNMKAKKTADQAATMPYVVAAERDGKAYLHKLRDYLNKNASEEKYATYYESDLYEEIEDGNYTPSGLTNDSTKKIFRM